ncbi:MAG: acetyl-CoA carboxylase biotin carboxyl carrier protein [Saprospiraceae bacterium]|nr:acetyl-CoA carboxylase biotin carboxyl carrier protein [Saprospiraceae bacterium]
MTFKEIQDLIKLIQKTDLTEFKLKKEDMELVIRTKQFQKGGEKVSTVAPAPIVSMPHQAVAAPHAQPPISESAPAAPPAPAKADHPASGESETSDLIEIKSPIVGTFYRSPGPDKPPFKKVGDMVEPGETVCIVEAMKLFNEIESEVGGKIVKVVTEDASPCEYDQVLFLVDPKG